MSWGQGELFPTANEAEIQRTKFLLGKYKEMTMLMHDFEKFEGELRQPERRLYKTETNNRRNGRFGPEGRSKEDSIPRFKTYPRVIFTPDWHKPQSGS
ncbi:hypothetical protein ACQKLN_03380 [Paenibacillus glucanolyticus]|uniref:hypothetical protein n=1 Tax=Paenibacillus glucanolyticus TaxID=59843 RepID=UPI003D032822